MISYFGRVFTHAGVLAVFKPRRGRLKIPVAPTGKLKLHIFPLRRAKENKGFSPFNPHAPFKKGSILNFLSREFGIDTFLKGSWVSRGQSPPLAGETNVETFSQLKNVPVQIVAARRPKILS